MSTRRPIFIAVLIVTSLLIILTIVSSPSSHQLTDFEADTVVIQKQDEWEEIVPLKGEDGIMQIAVPDSEKVKMGKTYEEDSRVQLATPAVKEVERGGVNATVGKGAVRKPAVPMMSKMGNETLKAELGRAAWRLLHTMAGKFPYKPTEEQKTVMRDYIYLFAQLYPCGDCARHFAIVLEAHPPIVEDRISLSTWACDVHNVVNKRLNKTLFDCATVLEVYKCGCAEEDGATMTIPDVKPTGKPKTVDMETVKMLGRPKLGKAVKEK